MATKRAQSQFFGKQSASPLVDLLIAYAWRRTMEVTQLRNLMAMLIELQRRLSKDDALRSSVTNSIEALECLEIGKDRVPPQICDEILDALNRVVPAKVPGATAASWAVARRESGYRKLKKKALSFNEIATFMRDVKLDLDALVAVPPKPWDKWPPGQKLWICVGTRRAMTQRGSDYYWVQRDDQRTASMLQEFFGRFLVGCQPCIHECEIDPKHGESDAAKTEFEELRKGSAGIIVLGSDHANGLFYQASQWVKGKDDPYSFEWHDDPSKDYLEDKCRTRQEAGGLWPRDRAGLLRIRYRDERPRRYVVAVAAGLGPVGTTAAAQALTCVDEIAQDFDPKGRFSKAVIVDNSEAVCAGRPGWRWDDDLQPESKS